MCCAWVASNLHGCRVWIITPLWIDAVTTYVPTLCWSERLVPHLKCWLSPFGYLRCTFGRYAKGNEFMAQWSPVAWVNLTVRVAPDGSLTPISDLMPWVLVLDRLPPDPSHKRSIRQGCFHSIRTVSSRRHGASAIPCLFVETVSWLMTMLKLMALHWMSQVGQQLDCQTGRDVCFNRYGFSDYYLTFRHLRLVIVAESISALTVSVRMAAR